MLGQGLISSGFACARTRMAGREPMPGVSVATAAGLWASNAPASAKGTALDRNLQQFFITWPFIMAGKRPAVQREETGFAREPLFLLA